MSFQEVAAELEALRSCPEFAEEWNRRLAERIQQGVALMRAETCCRCRQTTHEGVIIRRIETGSGPLEGLYACPDCAGETR